MKFAVKTAIDLTSTIQGWNFNFRSISRVFCPFCEPIFLTSGYEPNLPGSRMLSRRQGGILSPLFFNLYMGKLSVTLSKTKVGCALGKTMVNHLAYAVDLVIISPSAKGLQSC